MLRPKRGLTPFKLFVAERGGVDDRLRFLRARAMAQHQFESQGDPVVSAIERVLEAERIAEKQLQHCRQQAQAMVAAARDTAAAITVRRNARTSKLHTSYLQKIARDIAGLAHPIGPTSEIAESPSDVAAWSKAAERLAAQLTGDEDELPR